MVMQAHKATQAAQADANDPHVNVMDVLVQYLVQFLFEKSLVARGNVGLGILSPNIRTHEHTEETEHAALSFHISTN